MNVGMSWGAALMLLLVLGAPLLAVDEGHAQCHMYFVIYGDPECPACISMSVFVGRNYGLKCLEFRSIRDERWRENYDTLISMLGLDAYVPLVGLLVDGRLKGISQGVVDDKGFWDDMARSSASSQIIPVYGFKGNHPVSESIPVSRVEQYFIPITPTAPIGISQQVQSSRQGSKGVSLVLPTVILVFAVLILWLRWRK